MGDISIRDSFPNTDRCSISASISDEVTPIVRSCSLDNRQLYLSSCTSDQNGSINDPVRSCYYTLTYEVAEDMAISSLCSTYDRDLSGCNGNENATERYGPGTWQVSEVGVALVPPYLEGQGGSDSVGMQRDQIIMDWQFNTAYDDCSGDVKITDDVPPVIVELEQTCFSDPVGITPGTIRLLQTETETVIPESLVPAPRAVDADIYDFHVDVTILDLNTNTVLPNSYSLQYDAFRVDPYDGQGFVAGYVDEAVSLPVGVYQFEYLFRDSHSETSTCYSKVEVLPAFEPLASQTQTSLFLIQEAIAGGGSGIDSTDMELSLQYVYATSYPFVSDPSSAVITATSPPTNINYDPLSNLTGGDLYCEPGRTEAGPEVSHTEAEGYCFRTYEITGDFTNCSAVDQTISITHPILCSPTTNKTYHYDSTGPSPLDYTLSSGCLDDQEDQSIAVDMYSQSFCQTQIGSVALDGILAVGDNSWMSARLDATTEGTDYDDYYDLGGTSLEPFTGAFVIQGSAPDETIELCLVFVVETDGGVSPGSVQFDSVNVDEVYVSWSNESGVDPADVTLTSIDWTEHSTSQGDPNERTNMIGLCFQQPRPAELAVNGTNSEGPADAHCERVCGLQRAGPERQTTQAGQRLFPAEAPVRPDARVGPLAPETRACVGAGKRRRRVLHAREYATVRFRGRLDQSRAPGPLARKRRRERGDWRRTGRKRRFLCAGHAPARPARFRRYRLFCALGSSLLLQVPRRSVRNRAFCLQEESAGTGRSKRKKAR